MPDSNKCPLVDFHCHVDLFPDPQAEIKRSEERNICTLAVTTLPAAFKYSSSLYSGSKRVIPALGYHPELIEDYPNYLPLFLEELEKTNFVGEVGLDGGVQYQKSMTLQRNYLAKILNRCHKLSGRIISLHSRRAAELTLREIEESRVTSNNKVLLHWFSGRARLIEWALDLGCFFSINEMMVRTARGKKLVAEIPVTRVLTETDLPLGGRKRQMDREVSLDATLDALSIMWSMPASEARAQIYQNYIGLVE